MRKTKAKCLQSGESLNSSQRQQRQNLSVEQYNTSYPTSISSDKWGSYTIGNKMIKNRTDDKEYDCDDEYSIYHEYKDEEEEDDDDDKYYCGECGTNMEHDPERQNNDNDTVMTSKNEFPTIPADTSMYENLQDMLDFMVGKDLSSSLLPDNEGFHDPCKVRQILGDEDLGQCSAENIPNAGARKFIDFISDKLKSDCTMSDYVMNFRNNKATNTQKEDENEDGGRFCYLCVNKEGNEYSSDIYDYDFEWNKVQPDFKIDVTRNTRTQSEEEKDSF